MSDGLIDIHSHVLPGVDDGSRDTDESLELLRGLSGAGFRHVFCTPHHGWGQHRNTPSNVPPRVKKLQAAVDEAGLDVTLHAGGEHAIFDDLSDQRPRDWSTPAGYFLLDFWQPRRPKFIEPAIRRLQSFGLKPIFAHPERYTWVQDDPDASARWFASLDVELQLNVYTLAGGHPDAEPVARRWLDEGRYTYA
ncbi:MAG: CpsB/CapC family capsule biosynthesis tyrosine phosphatase, partial [Planctomycetota bacterium]